MIQRRERNRTARAAFTLIEMLIVVAIIVALAGVGGYYFFATWASTQEDVARMQAEVLTKACQTYRLKNAGAWPASLEVLLVPDEKYANMPYLEDQNALKDPWGGIYQYDSAGPRNAQRNVTGIATKPDIWAVTKDGREVGNWPKD